MNKMPPYAPAPNNLPSKRDFWHQALAFEGSVTPMVMRRVLGFGACAVLFQLLNAFLGSRFRVDLGMEANPFQLAGAVLGVLLVFRTNSGYDRWWEARKLWGGIVNQSRNLAITTLSYGPPDAKWRRDMASWIAVFPHVARIALRGEKADERITALVGVEGAEKIAAADHMPSFVSFQIGQLLQNALAEGSLNQFAFAQAEGQRTELIDHIGGCERILKTPLPLVYAINIRQFIAVFLLILPLALLHQLSSDWLVPIVTMGVAYALLSLDQIGAELQNPFPKAHLSHLPLNDICHTIEKNVRALCAEDFHSAELPPEPEIIAKPEPRFATTAG